MKLIFSILTLFIFQVSFGQHIIPSFLKGHWKIEGTNDEEQWDVLSDYSMKGFGYKIDNSVPLVSEYLDIHLKDGSLILTATVLGQNEGKPIEFKSLTGISGKQIKFENYDHDFPQEISYIQSDDSPDKLTVRVAGKGKEKYLKMNRIKLNAEGDTTVFDQALATKLGSDEYGMKSYFYIVLKTGTNTNGDKDLINKAFAGHMSNINRLVKEEKLIIAGPFGKNTDQYRGLFIFNNVKSEEEVKSILDTDPAIKAGYLTYSIYTWYGSAALPLYLPYVDKITKSKF